MVLLNFAAWVSLVNLVGNSVVMEERVSIEGRTALDRPALNGDLQPWSYRRGKWCTLFCFGEFRMRRYLVALAVVACAIATSSSASAGIFGQIGRAHV